MRHEEEERYYEGRERSRRHRPQHDEEQQNFRSRWEEPRPFTSDRDRHHHDEEMRTREHYDERDNRPRHHYREDINSHQHGFSDDHHTRDRRDERREWRDENEGNQYGPENQHARDRWQQPEHLPPLREQRRRHQSRRDEDWDERGW